MGISSLPQPFKNAWVLQLFSELEKSNQLRKIFRAFNNMHFAMDFFCVASLLTLKCDESEFFLN